MSLVTVRTDCTVNQHLWDVAVNCSIARDRQLQKLCHQRCCGSGVWVTTLSVERSRRSRASVTRWQQTVKTPNNMQTLSICNCSCQLHWNLADQREQTFSISFEQSDEWHVNKTKFISIITLHQLCQHVGNALALCWVVSAQRRQVLDRLLSYLTSKTCSNN